MAIIHPVRSKVWTSKSRLRTILVFIWICSLGTGLPYWFAYRLETLTFSGDVTYYCLPSNSFNFEAFAVTNFIVGFVLPMVFITVLYVRVGMVLWSSSKGGNLVGKSSSPGDQGPVSPHTPGRLGFSGVGQAACSHTTTERNKLPGGKLDLSGRGGSGNESETVLSTKDFDIHGGVGKNGRDIKIIEGNETIHVAVVSSLSKLALADKERLKFQSSCQPPRVSIEEPRLSSQDDERFGVFDWRRSNDGECRGSEVIGDINQGVVAAADRHVARRTGHSTSMCEPMGDGVKRLRVDTSRALMNRRRAVRLLIAVVMGFAFCLLPYHVRLLWLYWGKPALTFWETLSAPIVLSVYYLNSGINPFLYAFLSENFRRGLKDAFTCKRSCASRDVGVPRDAITSRKTTYTLRPGGPSAGRELFPMFISQSREASKYK